MLRELRSYYAMSYIISFNGGNIFNNEYFPQNVNTQSKAVLKAMGKNLDLRYSTVDAAGAARDLAAVGYVIDSSPNALNDADAAPKIFPQSSDLIHKFATGVNQVVSEALARLFEEPIVIDRGYDVFRSLAQHTFDNQVAQYKDSFFSSSSRSEGRYFAYQMGFYSMKKSAYCFLVFSMISYREQKYIFGLPVSTRTGIACRIQIFPCKKIVNSFIYNTGVLRSGQRLASPNGQHQAILTADGNFVVGTRWQSGSALKGQSPYYLTMQRDGNLVIYDARNNPTWAAESWEQGWHLSSPYWVELHDDGNLVVRNPSGITLWEIGRA